MNFISKDDEMDNIIKINVENEKTNPFQYLRSKVLIQGVPVSIRKLDALMGGTVGYSHISELEKGKDPSFNQLKAYHEFFNVSYEFLLGETTDPYVPGNDAKPKVNTEIDDAIYILSVDRNKNSREKWKIVNMLLSTEKGQLLLSYLAELVKTEQRDKIYKKIDSLIDQDESLSYNELVISVNNEVRKYE